MRSKGRITGKREFHLLIFLLFTGLLTTGWHLKGSELSRTIYLLQEEVSALGEERDSLLNALSEQELIEEEWSDLAGGGGVSPPALPGLARIPAVLESFETFLGSFDLTVDSLRVGPVIFMDDHASVGLKLNISALASRLESFLLALEMFPYPLSFVNIEWQEPEDGNSALYLEIELFFLQQDLPRTEFERITPDR